MEAHSDDCPETRVMAKPVILTLDDEVQVLNAIERDLRSHYAKDYRIVKASSPTLALETLERRCRHACRCRFLGWNCSDGESPLAVVFLTVHDQILKDVHSHILLTSTENSSAL